MSNVGNHKEISVEQALVLTDALLYRHTGHHLSVAQSAVFRVAWLGSRKTYEQLAQELQYSANYIKQGVGPKLWRSLTEIVGEKVTKTTAKTVLGQYFHALPPQSENRIERPEGVLALDSPFYIDRGDSEQQCLQEVDSFGAFIRIKAPRKMGKSSLLNRVLAHARMQDYDTVQLNFQQAETSVRANTNGLLRWVCANLSMQLGFAEALDDYWDDDLGSKMSCNLFFESHVLRNQQKPLVIAFEEVNELLQYPQVAHEFLTLMRFWHERVKVDEAWRSLRLIMVHSTEIYLSLDTNQSPLNIGLVIDLKPFSPEEVTQLIQSHQLQFDLDEVQQIMDLTGGHPYLVRLTLYHWATQGSSLAEILAAAATDTGIYHHHLHRHLRYLEEYPEIADAFRKVLVVLSPVAIAQVHGFKLQSLGLVTLIGNRAKVSCELYQRYFGDRLEFASRPCRPIEPSYDGS